MLKHRLITAAILIAIVLLVLFYLSPPYFLFLTGFMTLLGAWEWSGLMEIKRQRWRLVYVCIMAFALYTALFVPVPIMLTLAFAWWLLAIVLVASYPRGASWWSKWVIWRGVMGIMTLLPAWAAINFIRNVQDGSYALLYLFAVIWGADTAAYFVGKQWGKTKLAPLVSPGKSVQGLIGALAASILITTLLFWAYGLPFNLWMWGVSLSLVTVVFSVVGDLFESTLKRQAGVKDSGRILPGHGGVLDRIDSLTAAAPVFALGWMAIAAYLN